MVLDGVGLGEADFPFFEELPVFGFKHILFRIINEHELCKQ